MKNQKKLCADLMICITAMSFFMCSYSMVITKVLARDPKNENLTRSLSSYHIEELLQKKIIRASDDSLEFMHPLVFSYYYSRVLPHSFERFVLFITRMSWRVARRLQSPARYVLVAKDTCDAKITIQKLSTQSGADYLAVNPLSDLSGCGEDEINQLFSGLCTEAKKSGRPVVLFIEEADFLLNNSKEIVTGVDVPALSYAIANHEDSEHLTIVIHIQLPQNISKSRERYLDCSWLFLPLIDFDVRRNMAADLFHQRGISIDDAGLDLLAARTEGYTITEMRDIVNKIIACARTNNQCVHAKDIHKYFSQLIRFEWRNKFSFKGLNFNTLHHVVMLSGTCYLGALGIIGTRYVLLKKVAVKNKENNNKSVEKT